MGGRGDATMEHMDLKTVTFMQRANLASPAGYKGAPPAVPRLRSGRSDSVGSGSKRNLRHPSMSADRQGHQAGLSQARPVSTGRESEFTDQREPSVSQPQARPGYAGQQLTTVDERKPTSQFIPARPVSTGQASAELESEAGSRADLSLPTASEADGWDHGDGQGGEHDAASSRLRSEQPAAFATGTFGSEHASFGEATVATKVFGLQPTQTSELPRRIVKPLAAKTPAGFPPALPRRLDLEDDSESADSSDEDAYITPGRRSAARRRRHLPRPLRNPKQGQVQLASHAPCLNLVAEAMFVMSGSATRLLRGRYWRAVAAPTWCHLSGRIFRLQS